MDQKEPAIRGHMIGRAVNDTVDDQGIDDEINH